ncbi:DUF5916 domain-containing protein [Rufibacter glacialis]|uniref:Carbohydrate binding family 9 domain-containing protein n=1 Tax=Rufibacter glacialis TaxID=1259555 RepID=A0A5M8QKW4_9BACT|nr:DUF5916 domain-containing protein [Rufibacter glacialis]KAA6435406.1 carbohydrate binding family 9 domain-containing protein [Rufibacter glacialis]GGK63124.1 hypothetical protein GCM10011405_08980 [Rufibacter glacialis]
MKYACLLFLCICSTLLSYAQAPKVTKQITAVRTTTPPKLDGLPDEDVWKLAPPGTDFIQNNPANGSPARQRTEVRLLYDDEAVYVSAMLFDTAPDSILSQLSARDGGQVNADMFGVYFDTYQDKQNAFGFEVSTAGVQTDFKATSNGDQRSWDAVWQSMVARHPQGWSVEMRIPYSAIRFPKKDVQTWGINFWRSTRRFREDAFWNFVDNSVQGFVNQFGEATGISGLKAPLRLSLMPYLSGYLDHYPHDEPEKKDFKTTVNGGMDIKYGINDAFTLDMTLIPDFGQTQSDAQVLNLSPFEVRFNENRQFFTEGTELFNKAGLFYSRRIGAEPLNYNNLTYDKQRYGKDVEVLENPEKTSLVNATKLSGRTNKGLGIGLFNAVTRNTYATLRSNETQEEFEVLTDPVTNYNVLVLDQSLPYSSYVTFTNTNVTRGHGFYNANVTGLMTKLTNKKNSYTLNLSGNLSQKYNKGEVPVGTDKVELGHMYSGSFGKTSGNFQFRLRHTAESHTYDINDLGYLGNNNSRETQAYVAYNVYKPFWKLNNLYNALGVQHRMLYKPAKFAQLAYFLETNATTKKFLSFGSTFVWLPKDGYDYFEPRSKQDGVPDRKWRKPAGWEVNSYVSSDYRKKLAVDVNFGFYIAPEYDQFDKWVGVSPRVRVNDHLQLVYKLNYNHAPRDFGFAGNDSLYEARKISRVDSVFFGQRVVKTVSNTVTGTYIFNARTALNINLRHYWSNASFDRYLLLQEDGNGTQLEYRPKSGWAKDRNFNAFNVDLVYSWRFAPGSEVSVVWKNAIFDSALPERPSYFLNLRNTLQAKQLNNFSVKVLYYLDYQVLKRALKRS